VRYRSSTFNADRKARMKQSSGRRMSKAQNTGRNDSEFGSMMSFLGHMRMERQRVL
jgi:hypothetical protein